MFSIHKDLFAGYTLFKLLNEKTGEYVNIIPEYGAIIQELVLVKKNILFSIIDGVSEAELPANPAYKSSLLFPFPGRIKDGQYNFKGKSYQLPVNEFSRNNSLHGLILDKKFEVSETKVSEKQASIDLTYTYKSEIEGYPFDFLFKISYYFSDKLQCFISITNIGKEEMPVGFGWHPYFKTNVKVDKLKLKLPANQFYELDEQMIQTGKMKRGITNGESVISLEGVPLDHGFRSKKTSTVFLEDPSQDIKINIRQNYNQADHFWQVYTPGDRNSIAIEPQTCLGNAFNTQEGLIVLKPKQEWKGKITVNLD